MRLIVLTSVLAVLSLPVRAGTLGTIPVDPDREVDGTLGANGRQEWRLKLERGKFYAVWSSADSVGGIPVSVQAAGGKAVGHYIISTESNYSGTSFKAPYTGLYTIVVACQGQAAPYCAGGQRYTISAGRDCPGDASTPCGIAVGQTLHDLQMHFVQDDDWFRTELRGGVSYAVSATSVDGQEVGASVYDAEGRDLANAICDGSRQPCLAFTAPTSGRYFVGVHPADDGAPPTYDLTLAVSR